MSVRASTWAWEVIRELGLPHGQGIVLLRVADHADHDGVCWPGVAGLQPYVGLGDRQIRTNLGKLEAADVLHRERRQQSGKTGRQSDLITLHVEDLPATIAGKGQRQSDDTLTGSPGGFSGTPTPAPSTPGEPSLEPSVEPPALLPTTTQQVFDHWTATFGKNGATRLDATRRRRIQARMNEGLTVADLCQAIDGCAASDYHMKRGRHANRDGIVYDELKMILRDRPQVEKLMAIAVESDRRAVDHSAYDRSEN